MMPQSELLQHANHHLNQGNYPQAIELYEQLIELNPLETQYRWLLGLSYLLNGDEAEAQLTWSLTLAEAEAEQLEESTGELVEVLQQTAQQQEEAGFQTVAWAIRQHIREIAPNDANNSLHLLNQLLQTGQFTVQSIAELGLIEQLQVSQVNFDLLFSVLQQVLDQAADHPEVLEFGAASSLHAQTTAQIQKLIDLLLTTSHQLFTLFSNFPLSRQYAELCLKLNPDYPNTLWRLATIDQFQGEYEQGIEFAKQAYTVSTTIRDKLISKALLLRGLLYAGANWQSIQTVLDEQTTLLQTWLEQPEIDPDQTPESVLLGVCLFFYPYFQDEPQTVRRLQNQVMQFCQQSIDAYAEKHIPDYRPYPTAPLIRTERKQLRIGYISNCFRRHSVGWLSRWIFRHHDRERFEIYTYFNQQADASGFSQQWFADPSDHWRCLTGNEVEAAKIIRADDLDILVDLDSLTFDPTSAIMALKPAPVQVTWLGLDATGLPTIDYFIADPYVLPKNAQDYYSEKIWRLPRTYIAVDGFEIEVPTLRRDDLNIPGDAIVYFSSQFIVKRHPETVRLQMQILKQVPNSYFLIKGLGNQQNTQEIFEQIAAQEGVAANRLRFLPHVPIEEIHRANLGIADVVLDTFPYNGATTTLETLWMGIPLVTKVGNQFAARNSYGMMMNAGITEGIAWTDTEYVEWGIHLGTDAELRKNISWKLRQSRQTAPLWNAKQFTRDMETAYEQMWQHYLVNHN